MTVLRQHTLYKVWLSGKTSGELESSLLRGKKKGTAKRKHRGAMHALNERVSEMQEVFQVSVKLE